MLFKAKVPGSLMLLGEYAVLEGYPALVCAVDKYITVQLIPRTDTVIEIQSVLGHYQQDLTQLKIVAPFQFVLATLNHFQKNLKQGCTLIIESEFSDQIGFASSAAVTVATLAVLTAWLDLKYSPKKMVYVARSVVQKVQGLGSGADVAACVYGGMVAYQMKPLGIKKLSNSHPLTVLYSGFKTPTVTVVKHVKQIFSNKQKLYKQLLRAIASCSKNGITAVKKQNWAELGRLMNIQQGLMDALGVNTPLLNQLIQDVRAEPNITGAKISGSGLGDCVVALGAVRDDFEWSHDAAKYIPIKLARHGVSCEKI